MTVDEYDSQSPPYLDPDGGTDCRQTKPGSAYSSIWAAVKEKRRQGIIKRLYITGIGPMRCRWTSINSTSHGAPEYSATCGLTRNDVHAALTLICCGPDDVEQNLVRLADGAGGCCFAWRKTGAGVFSTEAALEHLQACAIVCYRVYHTFLTVTQQLKNHEDYDPEARQTSEFLQFFPGSRIAWWIRRKPWPRIMANTRRYSTPASRVWSPQRPCEC